MSTSGLIALSLKRLILRFLALKSVGAMTAFESRMKSSMIHSCTGPAAALTLIRPPDFTRTFVITMLAGPVMFRVLLALIVKFVYARLLAGIVVVPVTVSAPK